MEQVEQDPEYIALSRQFKATAMELISVLEQVIFWTSKILMMMIISFIFLLFVLILVENNLFF